MQVFTFSDQAVFIAAGGDQLGTYVDPSPTKDSRIVYVSLFGTVQLFDDAMRHCATQGYNHSETWQHFQSIAAINPAMRVTVTDDDELKCTFETEEVQAYRAQQTDRQVDLQAGGSAPSVCHANAQRKDPIGTGSTALKDSVQAATTLLQSADVTKLLPASLKLTIFTRTAANMAPAHNAVKQAMADFQAANHDRTNLPPTFAKIPQKFQILAVLMLHWTKRVSAGGRKQKGAKVGDLALDQAKVDALLTHIKALKINSNGEEDGTAEPIGGTLTKEGLTRLIKWANKGG